MPLITMHRELRTSIRDLELSRPFRWRFCSEADVVVNVETELDATKVMEMADAAWNGRTRKPQRADLPRTRRGHGQSDG